MTENFQYFYDNVARMGRHVNHDERSRAFAFDEAGVTVKSVRHARHIPVLDQGNLGSCTGNAMTGLLGSGTFYASLPTNTLDPVNATYDETVAVSLYSLATKLDGYKGAYPPDDTGSDGLSVAKAAQQKGWIAAYQHTFSFNAFLSALSLQPVIVGIDWYDSFFNPNSEGLITITQGATIQGGHEIVADEIDTVNRRVGFTNSWGVNWGVDGRFYIRYIDMETLLGNNGDATVPVALSPVVPTPTPPAPPAPTPTPVPPIPTPTPVPPTPAPTPDPNDVALWADMQKWAKLKGLS